MLAPRLNKEVIENGLNFAPKFDDNGLIPCVTTDAASGEVLMVAYMNEEALLATLEKREAVYFSRSRAKLWHKGATSGHVQKIIEIRTDCDQDVLLLKVEQIGPGCCHAGYQACFYRKLDLEKTEEAAKGGHPLPLVQAEARAYDPDSVYG
ncbi:MAG: phosphoribosyl-AMP cyclohydrolase [Verrucomicrobiota bacterium]